MLNPDVEQILWTHRQLHDWTCEVDPKSWTA